MEKLINLLIQHSKVGSLENEQLVMKEIRSWVGEGLEEEFYCDCYESIKDIHAVNEASLFNNFFMATIYRDRCLKQFGRYIKYCGGRYEPFICPVLEEQ